VTALIVRPDFYVYGSASGAEELQQLAADLVSDLAAYGVQTGALVQKPEPRSAAQSIEATSIAGTP
jgi:hypothetical protein